METLSTINFLMAAVFAACYCYQVVFAVARLLKKRRAVHRPKAVPLRRAHRRAE